MTISLRGMPDPADQPPPPDLTGETILITGGTGSFGSTMLERLLRGDVGQVRIFSRDELKQDDMRRRLADERVTFHIGDVRNPDSVAKVMRGVDRVFHAAALKQVPSCEFFPLEAVATNVIGSGNVLEAAHREGVRSVVCLSTDKAVYPINAMGMSKAMMEKTAQAFARNNPTSDTTVCVVRYGNVMYSRGSVIPLFFQQALEGRPLTVTDPEMTRFLMSLDEAVRLVEYAFGHGNGGDLFVRKAPASRVDVLARAVLRMLGQDESQVTTIGTRHGEKVFETLASHEELSRATDEGEYFRVPLDGRSLNYERYLEVGDRRIMESEDYTSHNTTQLDVDGVVDLVGSLPAVQAVLAESRR